MQDCLLSCPQNCLLSCQKCNRALIPIVHEERDGSIGCLRKCLDIMKIDLQVDDLAYGIANE
jgi:hypothetical protein